LLNKISVSIGGKGIVATEKEERFVTKGVIVFIPAGEKHWHGAMKGSEFSHIYVLKSGSKLTQFEE
jgi:quercetin dioxygenase-like cupin family protein